MTEALLMDQHQKVVGRMTLTEQDGIYHGTVNLDAMPTNLRRLFEEFDELVNDQVFELADRVEEKIAEFGLQVGFPEGPLVPAYDVQIYPSTGLVSLRLLVSAHLSASAHESTRHAS